MPTPRGRLIAGSGVSHPVGAVATGAVEDDLPLQVTVVLSPRDRRAHLAGPAMHPAVRPILSADEFATWCDPGTERIELVRDFARSHALTVREISRARHDVVLDGTAGQFARAFGVTLRYFEAAGTRYYAYDERVRLPRALRRAAQTVLGLDTIPTHRTHAVAAARAAHVSIADLERQYAFPTNDTSGRRIALLEFAGGYSSDDVAAYATRLGLGSPNVSSVPVIGPTGQAVDNAPLDRARAASIAHDFNGKTTFQALGTKYGSDLGAFMASLEVTMDIELALALGGGAAVDVYFAPSGVDGWRRALYSVIGFPVGGAGATHPPRPTVLSVSWGDSESVFGPGQLRMIERVLLAVRRAGVAVCCSSGDRGSVSAEASSHTPLFPSVNFPASSPSVLACGGTRLLAGDAARRPEIAWDERVFGVTMATGGGVSGFFALCRFGALHDGRAADRRRSRTVGCHGL